MTTSESSFSLDELDFDELLAACDLLTETEAAPTSYAQPQILPPGSLQKQLSSLQSSHAIALPPLAIRSHRKRTSAKRKDEIEQLRRQVNDLKVQLACTPNRTSKAPSEGTADFLWMKMSQRQETGRQRAEEENKRLHEAVLAQGKLIRNLRSVLRRAELWKEAVLNSKYGQGFDTTTMDEDQDVVKMLVESVEKHLSLRIEGDTSHRHRQFDEEVIGEILQKTNGEYSYERERSRVLAFSPELVDKVAWDAMCRGGILIFIQPTLVTDDLITSVVNHHASSFEGLDDLDMLAIRTLFVLKRYRRQGCVMTAWESVSSIPTSTKLGTPPLRWFQRGWGDSWSHQLPSGENGCRTWATVRASISVQGGSSIDNGEQGLKVVQVMAAALDESGRRVEKELENLIAIEAARRKI